MKKFSALEIMALSVLPEKARIERTAAICRKYRTGYNQRECKAVLTALGEPYGHKGRLTLLLLKAVKLQDSIAKPRLRRQRHIGYLLDDKGKFDPVAVRFRGIMTKDGANSRQRTVEERRATICIQRFRSLKNTTPLIWWDNTISGRHINNCRISNGNFLMILYQRWNFTSPESKLTYLCYRQGETIGFVVIKKQTSYTKSIDKGLESLESAQVKAARRKGYDVQIDWVNQAFLVKSPRRQKARSIPWKRHTRKKQIK